MKTCSIDSCPQPVDGVEENEWARATRSLLRRPLLTTARCLNLLGILVHEWISYWTEALLQGRQTQAAWKAAWLSRTCRRLIEELDFGIEVHGTPPRKGLCVSNHLSYLDIIALSATMPCSFVSKSEVRSWPVFGSYASLSGTIFVDRDRRMEVPRIAGQIGSAIESGIPLVLFPEGTSSGGSSVLPFRSSLFAPVASIGASVTPVAISYSMEDGDASEEACYWKDMTLVPHLLNLCSGKRLTITILFGEDVAPSRDRKILCEMSHKAVSALRSAHESGQSHHHLRSEP